MPLPLLSSRIHTLVLCKHLNRYIMLLFLSLLGTNHYPHQSNECHYRFNLCGYYHSHHLRYHYLRLWHKYSHHCHQNYHRDDPNNDRWYFSVLVAVAFPPIIVIPLILYIRRQRGPFPVAPEKSRTHLPNGHP